MEDPPARPLPAVHRLAPRVFYGWFIAAGTFLTSFVVVGFGFYGMAVFLDALCNERGWPRTSVSFATSLCFVVSAVTGSLIGRSVDRHGPRIWIAVGAFVMAVALLAIGRVDRPEQLYLAFPPLGVGFSMAGGVTASALITRWFVALRMRAMTVSTTGVSLGGVVLVPVATAMIVERGLAGATPRLAVLLLVVVLPVVVLVLRSGPDDHGLAADGDPAAAERAPHVDLEAQARRWSRREAVRTQAFWLLVVAFGGILFCQVGVAMHQISLLRETLTPEGAALAVSTTATGSILARIVVGTFADRLDKRKLAATLMTIQAGAIAILAFVPNAPAAYAASLVFGFTIGNLFMLQSLITAELFGMASFGAVFGLVQLLTQTGSGLGPYALGLLVTAFGSYRAGLVLLAGVALVSAVVISRVRPPPEAASR